MNGPPERSPSITTSKMSLCRSSRASPSSCRWPRIESRVFCPLTSRFSLSHPGSPGRACPRPITSLGVGPCRSRKSPARSTSRRRCRQSADFVGGKLKDIEFDVGTRETRTIRAGLARSHRGDRFRFHCFNIVGRGQPKCGDAKENSHCPQEPVSTSRCAAGVHELAPVWQY